MTLPNSSETLIFWAVDPFAEDPEVHASTARAILALISRQPARVRPVFVLEDDIPSVPREARERLVRQAQEVSQAAFTIYFANYVGEDLRGALLPLEVIGSQGASNRKMARALIDAAKHAGAGLIATSTHARKGPARWVLGSFAETLSLLSDVPLLVVNPHATCEEKFENVLFPTDFSLESREAFEQLLPAAKRMGSRVVIFHKFGNEVSPRWDQAFSAYPYVGQSWFEELKARRERAERWAADARAAGVEAVSIVDDSMGRSVTDAILQQSKKTPGLIALAGESGAFDAVLLGSIARHLLREASCPVWLIHLPRQEQEQEQALTA